jgi:hypothetical protein
MFNGMDSDGVDTFVKVGYLHTVSGHKDHTSQAFQTESFKSHD